MPTPLPQQARDLVDAPEMGVVATIQPDGQPQLTVVWVDRDGDDILFSALGSRHKISNLQRDPRVSVVIYPHDQPYKYLEVRGTAEITDDPQGDLIQKLSRKYTGDPYDEQPNSGRVIVAIHADKVRWWG